MLLLRGYINFKEHARLPAVYLVLCLRFTDAVLPSFSLWRGPGVRW